MLTCNLNVKFGLFNGSSGTVMDIIYPVGKFPKDGHPICVMVEFQQYTGLPSAVFALDKATKRAPGFKDSNVLVPGFITIYRLDSPSPIVIP
jgi:hypothetical protein